PQGSRLRSRPGRVPCGTGAAGRTQAAFPAGRRSQLTTGPYASEGSGWPVVEARLRKFADIGPAADLLAAVRESNWGTGPDDYPLARP
ncbi:MAG TPA: hypothetical protein VFW50_36700, partial [Streptosporangiaceae bacterium]|nr:hypothetical protein [Streptosporangiaceae bacterium]